MQLLPKPPFPCQIKGFLSRTYADPSSLEEIFHNNLVVVQVLSRLHLSMNVQVNPELKAEVHIPPLG